MRRLVTTFEKFGLMRENRGLNKGVGTRVQAFKSWVYYAQKLKINSQYLLFVIYCYQTIYWIK